MPFPTQVIALLPEYILTVAGVLIMLIEAVLKPGTSRKPLGWLAIVGDGRGRLRQLVSASPWSF